LGSAFSILIGDTETFEISGSGDGARVIGGIVIDLRHCHHRELLADEVPFERIVIYKNQAIEADIRLLRNSYAALAPPA
jgi:hypothetical protein